AENQTVPPADDPARPEQERPVLDGGKCVGDRAFADARILLLQRDDPEHRDDADEDERAFQEARGHVAERELLALSPHDRKDDDGRADVRDDEQQFQEHAEEDPVVLPDTRDVTHWVVEHRLVERERRDRRDERDEEEHAEDTRPLLIQSHPVNPFPGRWRAGGFRPTSTGYEGEPTPRSPALHSSSRDQGVRADALEAFAPEQPAPAERDLPAAGRADTHPRTAPPDADTGPALGEVEEQPRRDPLALPV